MQSTGTGPSPRTWSFVMAACWGLFGLWVMSTGQTWLGLAGVGLGVAHVAAAMSPKIEAWNRAPLFRKSDRAD